MFIMAATVIFVIGAIVVDIGIWLSERRRAATAADLAALAAVTEMQDPLGDPVEAGRIFAGRNGFNDASAAPDPSVDPDVVVNVTQSSPDCSSPASCQAEVTIEKASPVLFVGIFGIKSFDIGARAVAQVGGPCGLCVLDPGANRALDITDAGVTVSNASVWVNSDHSNAAFVDSGSLSAGSINVVGGATGSGTYDPFANTGVLPMEDPLASVTQPSAGGSCPSYTLSGPGPDTISQGCYERIVNNSNQKLTLQSGTYIIEDELAITGSGEIEGNNVMIYFKDGASLDISGNGDLNITGRTSGTHQGIALFWDRSDSSAHVDLDGTDITGTIYIPAGTVRISANGTYESLIVAAKVEINASGNVNIDFDPAENYPIANWDSWPPSMTLIE
jgi:hypothetical protein